MSIGVPIKVLHEAEGHIVTCETNTGEVYRGKLIEAEDNMNCQVGPAQTRWVPLFVIGNMRRLQKEHLVLTRYCCSDRFSSERTIYGFHSYITATVNSTGTKCLE